MAEIDQVRAGLAAFLGRDRRILEIACGTGWWTPQLAAGAGQVLAVDSSSEMLGRCRARVESTGSKSGKVRYLQRDLWAWTPQRSFDGVFFGFWLSHVPEDRFDDFWGLVDAALLPGGGAFFVDSAQPGGSSRAAAWPAGEDSETRQLNDGRRFKIVKRYYQPDWLRNRLAAIGWEFDIRRTAEFFIYGQGRRMHKS